MTQTSRDRTTSALRLPQDTTVSTFFMDESGSKGSGGRFVVIAAVQTRDPDYFLREIESVRQSQSFRTEFKFSNVTKRSLPAYEALSDLLANSALRLGAIIVDKTIADPFASDLPQWKAHNWLSAALIQAMVTRREIVTVLTDSISTPRGISYGFTLKSAVNRRFRCLRIASVLSLDSRTCDGLQAADLLASAIAYERKFLETKSFEEYAALSTPKAQLSRYVALRLGISSFADYDGERIRIRTLQSPPHTD